MGGRSGRFADRARWLQRWPREPQSRRSCSMGRLARGRSRIRRRTGRSVEVTPPPFIWVPAGRDSTYVLQVSTSQAFPESETRTFNRPAAVRVRSRENRCPPASGSGVTEWRRTRVLVLGRPRPFTVPEDARPVSVSGLGRSRPPHAASSGRGCSFPGQKLEQVRQWARAS